jgi:hypothetical protein
MQPVIKYNQQITTFASGAWMGQNHWLGQSSMHTLQQQSLLANHAPDAHASKQQQQQPPPQQQQWSSIGRAGRHAIGCCIACLVPCPHMCCAGANACVALQDS